MFKLCFCSIFICSTVAKLNLSKDYCPVTLPGNDTVNLGISIHVIYADVINNKLNALMYVREKWTDGRLIGLSDTDQKGEASEIDKLWQPDLSFRDATAVTHVQPDKTGALRIYSNGEILLSRKYFVEIPSCLFNFTLDGYDCEITVESYGQSEEEISITANLGRDSVSFNRNSRSIFRPVASFTKKRRSVTSTGVYANLVFSIVLTRH